MQNTSLIEWSISWISSRLHPHPQLYYCSLSLHCTHGSFNLQITYLWLNWFQSHIQKSCQMWSLESWSWELLRKHQFLVSIAATENSILSFCSNNFCIFPIHTICWGDKEVLLLIHPTFPENCLGKKYWNDQRKTLPYTLLMCFADSWKGKLKLV